MRPRRAVPHDSTILQVVVLCSCNHFELPTPGDARLLDFHLISQARLRRWRFAPLPKGEVSQYPSYRNMIYMRPDTDETICCLFLLIAPIKRIDWTLFGVESKFNQSPAGASAASR